MHVTEPYILEKWIWTDADFDIMGWHDSIIYGMKLTRDLSLDIDYIFKWNEPEAAFPRFTFFVAPCTLVFANVEQLTFELTHPLYDCGIEISDIEVRFAGDRHYYTILTHQGDISFSASGYTQTVRMYPTFQLGQTIDLDERGGFSFDTTTDNRLSPEVQKMVNERKARQYQHYTWAKERHILKTEMETLQKRRDENEISLKEFLIEKRQQKDKLAYYNTILKDTHYCDR